MNTKDIFLLSYFSKVARSVWKWEGKMDVSLKPLGAGKNFLSDAYFGTIKHFDFKNGEESMKIFIKVNNKYFAWRIIILK